METKQNIKYFIYARKSSESEDRQMESITDQLKVLQDIAKKRGLEIVDIFQESKSAKIPESREQFAEMIKRIRNGEANGILCWKFNRLTRNPVDGGAISWMLQSGVIERIVTSEKDYLTTDNVLLMSVEQGMANQFLRELSVDTKRGLENKAERGWLPSGSPLGYTFNPLKRKGEKEIVVDKQRFPVMRQIFEMVLAGTHNPKQALDYATNELGFRNSKGKKVSQSTIYYHMRNSFYYGRFEYPRESGNWYDGAHVPMLTKEEFNLVQSKIDPNKKPSQTTKTNFTYRGPMRCGECSAKVTAENKTKRQKNGNVHRYIYYHCTGRKDPNCTQGVIEEKPLIKEISRNLSKVTISKGFYTWALETLDEIEKKDTNSDKNTHERVQKEIDAVDKKLDALLNVLLNGRIDDDTYSAKKKELDADKEKLDALLNSHPSNQKDMPVKAETYLNLATDMVTRFEKGGPDERRRLYMSVGSDMSLLNKELKINLPSPLGVVSEMVSYVEKSKEIQSALKMFEPKQKVAQTHSLSDDLQTVHLDFSSELSEVQTNVRTSRKLSVKARPEYNVLTSCPLLRGQDSNL